MMSISIHKFLSRYYGISISLCEDISHKEVKKKFKFLRRCSFKYAKSNPELITTGKIIYVMDSFGDCIPYICPLEIVSSIDTCGTIIYDDVLEKDLVIDEILELPTYLLKEFLGKYKNKPSFYRLIKKELTIRGFYDCKKYKSDKEMYKFKIEESENNDKYKGRQKIKHC